MSKHNYTQYSNYKNNAVIEPVVDVAPETQVSDQGNVCVEEIIETPVVETMAAPEPIEILDGVIANCTKLNVRVAPNAKADVLCVLNVASEIEIDLTKSTDEWYHVCTATGIEGYCMRKFVNVCL